MDSSEDSFALYLCNSDSPSLPANQTQVLNHQDFFHKLLRSNDALEEIHSGDFTKVIEKKLILNPFFDEDLRCEAFQKYFNSGKSEDFQSEICRESYLSNSVNETFKIVSSKTNSIIDWKEIKLESLERICSNFIEDYAKNSEIGLRNNLKNKILNDQF